MEPSEQLLEQSKDSAEYDDDDDDDGKIVMMMMASVGLVMMMTIVLMMMMMTILLLTNYQRQSAKDSGVSWFQEMANELKFIFLVNLFIIVDVLASVVHILNHR